MSTEPDDAAEYDRLTVERSDESEKKRGRLGRLWDTLQRDTEDQDPQTVARQATLNVTGGNVEDVDPPEDIGEYVELYYGVGAIRKNINEFVDDVTAPGLRVESDHAPTEDYFMGGDSAPEGAPGNGFLSEAFVFDETRQPFGKGLEISVRDRWVRGTVLVEYVKADPEDPESIISGFKFIRPETVSARTYPNTVQLINPEDTANADKLTPRGEAAAYVQFDEASILARRLKERDEEQFGKTPFADKDTWKGLSQNDVLKLVLDQDIGGSDPEDGVFGESVIRTIDEDATEYQNIKRNLTKAIQGKAWGIWTLQMNDYVLDAGDEKFLVAWEDDDIDATTKEVKNLEPGDSVSTDAKIELNRHDGDVPELEWVLKKYYRDIIDPLPGPFYKHADAIDINQFVTDEQQEDYQDRIKAEREYQAEQWEMAFREVARRHDGLQAESLRVFIEPEQDESPVMSLDDETVERMSTIASAMADLYGPGGAPSFVSDRVLNELILQLPEDATVEGAAPGEDLALEDMDEEQAAEMRGLMNGD